jgi:predicted amidohydrolase YtcJ
MSDRPAELVLRGGSIQTMDPARRWVRALAVRDRRVAVAGTDAEVEPLVGPATRVVDLAGRTVLPGFGDAHCHPITAGIALTRCNLHDLRGKDRLLTAIRDYADANPDLDWIVGEGWYMADFPGGNPHRADLDAIVPHRPVYLENRDGHGAWVNSRALDIAGITASTPDPSGGRIERDRDGSPSGTLHEGAMRLVARLLPADTPDELAAGLRAGQAYLHALGITNWQDARVDQAEHGTYQAAAARGELTARVVGALRWNRHGGDEQIPELVHRRDEAGDGRYRATSIKFFQDGVVENFTAGMLEPYLDAAGRPTSNRGYSNVDPEALKRHVTALDREGFQAHFHAIGDRAVRESLDAIEAALTTNGPSDRRHHVAHLQVVHSDDLPRFHRLRAVANAQPLWAVLEAQMTELTIPFLGPERAARQYPFGSLLRTGAMLAMGSDWAVSTPNVLEQVEVAVNRVSPSHRDHAPFYPDERIDLLDALHAFTMGTAYVNHLEREVGSLEIGKAADLVVLDRDVFDRAAGPIGDARVAGTFMDGQAVYEDAALDG